MKANMSASHSPAIDDHPNREGGRHKGDEPGVLTDENSKYWIGQSKATFMQMNVAFVNPPDVTQDPVLKVRFLDNHDLLSTR
jgi:hypothetical protein